MEDVLPNRHQGRRRSTGNRRDTGRSDPYHRRRTLKIRDPTEWEGTAEGSEKKKMDPLVKGYNVRETKFMSLSKDRQSTDVI